ncbi:MAG TPA: signal peptide peptidase SppA, partial [Saprospiraceae bacterium]|nr:signal peptide peptidase SppA [Saprospiraceae bacterium]
DDDKIKAIVMRINSPGGSVMASENIYRALEIAKQKGKKIVASMGDYAASGGYYIACPADSIFAENETLTGSIGVFSLFPDVSVLMNDKIGIHLDTVKTGRYAGGFNPVMGLSEGESAYFQNFVDEIYERFLKIVGESRNMSRDEVHKIAQGRVWSGRRAQTLGLVDAIGNMDRSISAAANMAGLEKYRVVTYPKPKEPIEQIIEKITGEKDDGVVKTLQKDFAEWTPYFETLYELKTMKGPQYRLPYIVDFK